MDRVLAVILAGGQGERLSILSLERAKPAVPFAGKYRIIDFTLSNCVNSGVFNVIVLTQYQPVSLTEHIGIGNPWGLVPPDRQIRLLQPFIAREKGGVWYKGTADAVYQNIDRIEPERYDDVLILSGDHVYKMDYAPLLEFHRENNADATLAVTHVPEEELHRFGTVVTDEKGKVTRFQEKVKQPKSNLVSMGVYVFKTEILREWLESRTGHDFGRNIFPKMVNKGEIFAYNFDGYWRDIGTVESYWQANMEMLEISQSYLHVADWPLYTSEVPYPSTKISKTANVVDCLISSGCIVDGQVEHSILSPGVTISSGAVVKDSIIMDDTVIGSGSIVERSILDKEVVVEAGCHIGYGDDYRVNSRFPNILNTGISIAGKRAQIPAGFKIGRNCIIYANVIPSDYPTVDVPSGETIKPRRRNIRVVV